MTNDTSTLSGSLDEMKDQLISELGDKGVTASYSSSTGLLGLIGEISNIQTGGTSCPKLVMGEFTTGSTGGSTGSASLNYTGSGYPIMFLAYVKNGVYNNSSTGDTTWYNSTSRYDVGLVIMVKADTTTTPTYSTSGTENTGAISYVYKNNSSTATSYGRSGSMTANTYTSSSTNASTSSTMIRFKGNGKSLSYYVGNRTSSTYGLARSTTFSYIIVYSE